jgi:diguanylate cyclase (GGDEF)-like protein/PAS domain S-box-containing protein
MVQEYKQGKKEINSFNFIIDEMDALVYVIDIQSYKILYSNKKCEDEFGDVVGKTCYKALQKNRDKPCIECPLSDENNRVLGKSLKWEHKNTLNGKTYLFSDKIVRDNITGGLSKVQVGIDISKQKILEEEILKQQSKTLETFEALFNSTIEGLIIYDRDKKCIRVNNMAPKLLGYSAEEMIGMYALDFIEESSCPLVSTVIEKDEQEPYEVFMVKKSGDSFPALIRGKNILLNDEKIRVSAIIDITQIKEKEAEVSRLAYFDALTSLPNRVLFKDRVNLLISKSARYKTFGAFLFIDLDYFKTVNDTKGHDIGDKILIECSKRLKKIIRSSDSLARFGGDEFILLIDTQKMNRFDAIDSIKTVANKILKIIRKPFIIEDSQYQLSASIGISIFNDETSFEELLRKADGAMYYAKEKGRDNFSFFDPLLQKSLDRKAIVLDRLREAIALNKIEIAYQKQVGLNKEVIGVEALARWNDEKLGFVSPAEFIPIAEEGGLIITFGYFLIEEVVKVLKEWEDDEIKSKWRVSINVSLSQFEKDDFEFFLEDIIYKYKVNANLIRLEITESLLLKNSNKAVRKIDFLKDLGLTISIDDFGTGYSSLAYLKKLSIDELKIDKSFIDDIVTNESDEAIVTAILGIGNKFGFDVIAEGVETEEMHEKLLKLGCKYFQGYLFFKPMSKEKL